MQENTCLVFLIYFQNRYVEFSRKTHYFIFFFLQKVYLRSNTYLKGFTPIELRLKKGKVSF